MKWFDSPRMRPVLILLVVSVVLSSGTDTKAGFSFGTPVNIGSPPNSAHADLTPSISSDGLEVYFWSNRPSGFGNWDLWGSTRISTEEAWLPATNLGARVNSAGIEALPCISADGLELFFSRGSQTTADLMVARRTARTQSWGTPDKLRSVVNSSARDDSPRLTGDGLELYFISDRTGGRGLADIWVASRATTAHEWSPPVNLSVINSSAHDQWVTVSADGLTLLFQSTRAGGEYGGLYMSTRKSRDGSWPAPAYLGLPMDGSVYTLLSGVSANGTMLYLSDHINYAPRAGGAGSADMWQVPVIPVVDFSGDYRIDIEDLLVLIEHWGRNEPSLDIGPTPWGDGVVDAADLEILMSCWDQEVDDPHFIAHWRLDETEGDVAYDSAAENDAIVMGDAHWQPDSGQIDGALQFDGVDDYIYAPFVLNPADTVFSVFAWIKGAAPGQVIISQEDGVDWLLTDVQGCLMSQIKSGGRRSDPLYSDSIITDDNWHRIGFTWDGTNRILYVDDIEVASDTQTSLKGSGGGLYIGAGKGFEAGSFWSGMIDDVRIYDRVVIP